MIPSAPTGLSVIVYNNKIQVKWIKNLETNIVGYNIYNSTTSGGGVSNYAILNNSLIEDYSEVKTEVISSQQTVTEIGGTRTTTTVDTVAEVYIYAYTHENLSVQQEEYYVVTAVNDLGEESGYSIEVSGTPLIIPTEVYTLPIRSRTNISLDYISTLLERQPLLDVKPSSVTRQLHIDPNSREFYYSYVRIDFASRAQSFLTLRNLDDANNDGVSDPVTDSQYKLLLKEAYFFQNDEDVQNLIDSKFDERAANNGVFRKAAASAKVELTFYTFERPTKDMIVNQNEIVSTVPTETEPAISFITLSSNTLYVSRVDDYYNPIEQRYELKLLANGVIPGSAGNVNSGTIINTAVAGFKVTNMTAGYSGIDKESNSDLADRADLAIVGLDVGTINGYKKTTSGVFGVSGVEVAGAGDPLMQRDYDEIRKKHIFGKVDIYIRGGTPVEYKDYVGFLFKQNIDEDFDIIDNTNLVIRSANTTAIPIYTVSQIRNATRSASYDILGNWRIFKNTFELSKGIEVSLDLTTSLITFENPLIFGDVITATYDYKTAITGEVVVDPAGGGEVSFVLTSFPIVKYSHTIYKNDVALVYGVDYSLNLSNGSLTLSQGLDPGDKVTADYQYITSVLNEIVLSSATGGEVNLNLANTNVLESLIINTDGITLEIEKTNYANNNIGMGVSDIVRVTYRYRQSDPILLLNQPAESVTSIIGSISGTLQPDVNYTFDKIDDIQLEGNSVKSVRSIQILYNNGIPTGDVLSNTEQLTLVNNEYTLVSQKSADPDTVLVKMGATIYQLNYDYLVRREEDGINLSIARTVSSSIPNGAEVTVDYKYGELLTITYNVNPLIKEVQDKIEANRCATADVLVKEVLETKIDFQLSVIVPAGADNTIIANDIRTAISNEIVKHQIGEGISQSDIIRIIEGVSQVRSVIVPLTKMVKANGTQINREPLNCVFSSYQSNVVPSYTSGIGALLQKTLGNTAGDGFYGIFEDERPLTIISSGSDVDNVAGQGYISSDGEIIISTSDSASPTTHKYSVSYVVNGESGAKDIEISNLEYISTGDIVINVIQRT